MRASSRTLYVWTGRPCSYGCGDCPIDTTAPPPPTSAADLQHALTQTRGDDGLVVLLGGEPLINSELPRLLAVIRAAGRRPGIVTTARPLLHPQLRERLRRAGLAYMRVQFFGCGAVHDRHVALPGAFEQAITAVRTWLAEGDGTCDIDLALYGRGRSLEDPAAEVEELAHRVGSPDVQILVAADAPAVLADWNGDPQRPLLAWEGVPEAPSTAARLTIPARAPAFLHNVPRASCLGGVERAAAGNAAPPAVKANSFNFVRSQTAAPYVADPASCTAHRLVDGDERRLWLIEGDQLSLYATDTGDFAVPEIARIKDEWSHLFLDRSAAGVLDDFKEGMRRVLPDVVCDGCVNRLRCARRYSVVDGQPFASEEAWIASYVRNLRGRVLDVGCGEQLYRDEIVPRVRAGLVTYTGLDPDEPTLAKWRELLPEGRFFATGIEEFAGEPGAYAHVLCLRSLNHVLDLDDAIARMANMVAPGGQVLIVETTPFAMLRNAEQVAAADRAPRAGHQHYRNVTSEDVLPFARRHSLRVLHHHPVGLRTTNEWILLLERR